MRKFVLNNLIALISLSFLSFANAEDKNSDNTELNFYTGMFDFSDTNASAGILGLQHQNDELFRESFLGKISPITGGFVTEKNSFYFLRLSAGLRGLSADSPRVSVDSPQTLRASP